MSFSRHFLQRFRNHSASQRTGTPSRFRSMQSSSVSAHSHLMCSLSTRRNHLRRAIMRVASRHPLHPCFSVNLSLRLQLFLLHALKYLQVRAQECSPRHRVLLHLYQVHRAGAFARMRRTRPRPSALHIGRACARRRVSTAARGTPVLRHLLRLHLHPNPSPLHRITTCTVLNIRGS